MVKVKLRYNEIGKFKLILKDLKEHGETGYCPSIAGRSECITLFPKLGQHIHDKGCTSRCPCHSINDGLISSEEVITKVEQIIKDGYIWKKEEEI